MCVWNGTTNLDGDVALGDLPHIEAHCGNHVFAELARLQDTNTSGLFLLTRCVLVCLFLITTIECTAAAIVHVPPHALILFF